MKTIFLHNYKGFSKTFIPFTDVNFFVGENSTGKTAVLNLLGILSDLRFWFIPDFNKDSIELGYFNEIVNQNSKDKTSFEIGLELNNSTKGIDSNRYIWLKFKEKNNIPFVKEYRYISGNKSIKVNINTKGATCLINEFSNESFEEWINNSNSSSAIITKKVSFPEQNLPFAFIRSIVGNSLIGEDNKEANLQEFDFTPPVKSLSWIDPIRAKAKRYYESYKSMFSSEGQHTPIILKKIFCEKEKEKPHKIITELMKFGKSSRLFDEIVINDFGKESGSPFSVNIHYDMLSVGLTNVGYGVSQILPIIVEILTSNRDRLAIQQPEVHLHPKAQAAFGDLVFFSATENKNIFYIETHSDFTINRFRLNVFKSKSSKKVNGQVLYFERTKNGTMVTPLRFNSQGQYPDNIPLSYSQFFIDEELKMLEF